MTAGPFVWDVGENIIFEVLVFDPNTGLGLTGQTSFITITIQRANDSRYWSGSAWVTAFTALTVTEVDATNQPGRYTILLPGSTGNTAENRYIVHARIDNPPTIQGDNYEIHVSRITSVKIYESEPA